MSEDIVTRAEYHEAIDTAIQNAREDITMELITPAAAMERAHSARNAAVIRMRKKTSPIGLLVAKLWKPKTLPPSYYLERNAQKRFNKPFKALSEQEMDKV